MTDGFCRRLRGLIAGELPVEHDAREFVGHADVLRQLLEVAPDEIRDDLTFLHDLIAAARDATSEGVLGIFPRLQDPELAGVEGRISDYVAAHCGISLGDDDYEVGELPPPGNCAGWPRVGSPLTNNRFPYLLDTSASSYFSTQFWVGDGGPPGFIEVPAGGRVVFSGEYLRCRYFAFHPCDFDTNALPTLIDEDLDPDPGNANPFRGPVADGQGRRFTASLAFTSAPATPEPNTSYVGEKRNGGPNPAVFCLLRTSGSELGAYPPNSTGVLLPSITVFDADGNPVHHFDECDPYPPGRDFPVDTTHFAPLPIPDHRSIVRPGRFDVRSNWGLDFDLLASDDILYVGSPYARRLGEIYVVRAKALSSPHTPREPVYTPNKQVRGFTVSNYNFWAGIANTSIIDHDITRDDDGYMTLVVSTDENRPHNATAAEGCTWFDWGPYLDGQITFRFLLRQNPILEQLRQAVETGTPDSEIQPYVPIGGHCSRADFEANGWQAAFPRP